MKVLVTGCAGLIGREVSELLPRKCHTVEEVVGNLNSAYDRLLEKWRPSRFEAKNGFASASLGSALKKAFPNRLSVTKKTANGHGR